MLEMCLTYTLGADDDEADMDNDLYTIDPAKGPRSWWDLRNTLNAEATPAPGGTDRVPGDDSEGLQHKVTVIARDPHVEETLAPGAGYG